VRDADIGKEQIARLHCARKNFTNSMASSLGRQSSLRQFVPTIATLGASGCTLPGFAPVSVESIHWHREAGLGGVLPSPSFPGLPNIEVNFVPCLRTLQEGYAGRLG